MCRNRIEGLFFALSNRNTSKCQPLLLEQILYFLDFSKEEPILVTHNCDAHLAKYSTKEKPFDLYCLL